MALALNIRIVLLVFKFFVSISNLLWALIPIFVVTDTWIRSIVLIFAANDCDLHFIKQLCQVSLSIYLLFLLRWLYIESTYVHLLASVHFDHFVLPTELSLCSASHLGLRRPSLLSCERSWIVFDSIIISGFFSWSFGNLYAFDTSLLILDFFNVVRPHFIIVKGVSAGRLARGIATGDDGLGSRSRHHLVFFSLG